MVVIYWFAYWVCKRRQLRFSLMFFLSMLTMGLGYAVLCNYYVACNTLPNISWLFDFLSSPYYSCWSMLSVTLVQFVSLIWVGLCISDLCFDFCVFSLYCVSLSSSVFVVWQGLPFFIPAIERVVRIRTQILIYNNKIP